MLIVLIYLCVEGHELDGSIKEGYYTMQLYIGSRLQRESLILDTGSTLSVLTCVGCRDCGKHMNEYFDYTESSSFQLKEEPFYKKYAEMSEVEGFKGEDYVHIGGDTI